MKGRRFYKTVSVTADLGIALDGRPVKTRGKMLLRLPVPALAQAVAAEWEAQGETIDPAAMVMTSWPIPRLTGLRRTGLQFLPRCATSPAAISSANRAAEPDDLVARQSQPGTPIIDWAVAELGQPVAIWTGVMHRPQPAATLDAVSRWCGALSDFEIAAFIPS